MFNLLKKIYNYVLELSNTPFAPFLLFFIAFFEASFFPIPPDVLLIALVLGCRKKAWEYAFICSVASILGALLGYGIGYYLWWDNETFSTIANIFFKHIPGFTEIQFQKMQTQYQKYGFIIIFTAGFTPIPFKIFTISSGAFNIQLSLFIFAAALSRSTRFFLISILIWKYGKRIHLYIDRYFNYLTILLVVVLSSCYILIKYLF